MGEPTMKYFVKDSHQQPWLVRANSKSEARQLALYQYAPDQRPERIEEVCEWEEFISEKLKEYDAVPL